MERELYRDICQQLATLPPGHVDGFTYSDRRIAEVLIWAVLHDRPVSWACVAANWPLGRHQPLPSQSTMSRRVRTIGVQQLLHQLYQTLRDRLPHGLWKYIDGKPLPIGGCSKDRDARFGRAAGTKARGYKLVCIVDPCGAVDDWYLGPMAMAEETAGEVLIRRMPPTTYLVGDTRYDKTRLYIGAGLRRTQLVAPRKKHAKGLGHRRQLPERLASLALLETSAGQWLLHQRGDIERSYGHMSSFAAGLSPLPAWVRTPHRVAAWVQVKFIIDAARRLQLQRQTAQAA